MDLTTTYMGLKLRSPLVPSPSPLSEDISNIQRMEDAGAGAVVMSSLFEEQLKLEYGKTESRAKKLTYFPEVTGLRPVAERYLNQIYIAKQKVDIPIIASLNGSTVGGWIDCAHQIEQAGADALELNIYYIPTDIDMTGVEVEQKYIDILRAVKSTVNIPVAVKLSPYFSNMANMAKRLTEAGANGLVFFNRFYQPDIHLEKLVVEPNIILSTPQSMRLPLRWIAILYGRINTNLAATSGIHNGQDGLKMLLAGASITMLCSVLMRQGIQHIHIIEQEMREWMEKHHYESLQQIQGLMSQKNCSDPDAFERTQYVRSLKTYKPEWARIYEPSYYFG